MSLTVTFLLISLLTSAWIPSSRASTQLGRVCEGSRLRLSCRDPDSYIHVVSASYGRNAGPEICRNPFMRVKSGCHASSSLGRVRNACEGQRSCSIEAANHVFGDPCSWTHKYLEVRFECRTVATVTARACEGSRLSLSCPSYQSIRIVNANYGRTAGREVCPHMSIWVTSGCRASSSLRTVRAYCEGRRNCHVWASNWLFGDPCSGTHKYLEVSYVCN